MRTTTALFALLFLCLSLPAQQDTSYIVTSVSNEVWTPTALIEARNQIFRLQDTVRTMFKLNLIGSRTKGLSVEGLPSFTADAGLNISLGAEQKLSPSISLDLGLQLTLRSNEQWFTAVETRLEPRWYYDMKRRIRSGEQVNNLSGNYLGAEMSYTRFKDERIDGRWGLTLNWGVQRRLFNWGYFDVGYGLGIATVPATPFNRGGAVIFSRPRVRLGLVKVYPRPGTTAAGYCDALRCYREERRMLKVDLINLVDIYADFRSRIFKIRPSVAFEQKIGASSFSLNTEVSGEATKGLYKIGYATSSKNYDAFTYGLGMTVQPRWYYTLHRRIVQGRSGNNLSGLYMGLQVEGVYSQTDLKVEGQYYQEAQKVLLGAAPILGAQYRILRNGYIDFNLGAGIAAEQIKNTTTSGVDETKTPKQLYLAGGLKVGWVF